MTYCGHHFVVRAALKIKSLSKATKRSGLTCGSHAVATWPSCVCCNFERTIWFSSQRSRADGSSTKRPLQLLFHIFPLCNFDILWLMPVHISCLVFACAAKVSFINNHLSVQFTVSPVSVIYPLPYTFGVCDKWKSTADQNHWRIWLLFFCMHKKWFAILITCKVFRQVLEVQGGQWYDQSL